MLTCLELQLYLDRRILSGTDTLEFCEKFKFTYCRWHALTRKIFCAPASTIGVERLFSIASYLNSSKRLSLIDDNFEKLLFGHVNVNLCDKAARKRKVLDE